MAAISNTSPILNLAMIDQLSLLHQQFGNVRIPTAVLEELRADDRLPAPTRSDRRLRQTNFTNPRRQGPHTDEGWPTAEGASHDAPT